MGEQVNRGLQWVLALLGAVFGGMLLEFGGVLPGALLGYVLARVLDQQAQIRALEARLRELAGAPPARAAAAPAPARWDARPAAASTAAATMPPPDEAARVPSPAVADAAAARAEVPDAATTVVPASPPSGATVDDTAGPLPAAPPPAPAPAPANAPWPARTPQSVQAVEPGAVERALASVIAFFTTGNLVAKVGVLVLFVGVAFLVKYSIENALLPPSLRLVGAGLIGIVLLVVGYRLRARTDAYGLLLQGAGIGVLYLTVFAAFRLYELIPGGLAFAALVVIVVASSLLAVRQDSEAMAAFGLAGGFLAPVITSTGEGSHVALFSYYALLNLGILGMAWFRSWRWVNLLGFVFTFGIGGLWGARDYRPEHFATVEAFLIWFFLHFVVVSLLFARGVARALYTAGPGAGAVNGTLVFGLPIAVFGLQSVLVEGMPFALAYTALGMAAVYVSALMVARRWQAVPVLLGDSYLALTFVFASLAIPFAVADQRWTAAAWAMEGAGLVWIGLRQHRLFNRVFGLLLQVGGGVSFMGALLDGGYDGVDGFALACALLALSGGAVSWLYAREARAPHTPEAARVYAPAVISGLAMLWAWPWWVGGALALILEYADAGQGWRDALLLVVGGASVAIVARLGVVLRWPAARVSGHAWLPVLLLLAFAFTAWSAPLDSLQAVASWAFGIAMTWSCLHSLGAVRAAVDEGADHADAGLAADGARVQPTLLGIWHSATLVVVLAILVLLLRAQLQRVLEWDNGWLLAVAGALPVLALALLPRLRAHWPVRAFATAYLEHASMVLLGWLFVWSTLGGWVAALPAPLAYLPLGNPFELTQFAALLLGFGWLRERGYAWAPIPLAIAAFALVNQVTLRILHVFAGVPFTFGDMADSALVQTTLSLLWTSIALVAMFLGARRAARAVWIAGAGLLAVVVLKLLVVDLSGIGTVARIVSFMGVGGLMLLIGYLAPLPPAVPAAPAARRDGADGGDGGGAWPATRPPPSTDDPRGVPL